MRIARLRFRGRRLLRFLTLLTMVIPNTVLVIPIYLEVSAVGAVNNLWVVGLLMGFFPFGVYLAYIHFKTTLPNQILESARLDGLTDIQTFFEDRAADLQAGSGAGRLLQLRSELDQLLPPAGAAAPGHEHDRFGWAATACVLQPAVRPYDRRWTRRAPLRPASGTRHPGDHPARPRRVRARAALPCPRPDAGGREGVRAGLALGDVEVVEVRRFALCAIG